jgi:hypothetical protein
MTDIVNISISRLVIHTLMAVELTTSVLVEETALTCNLLAPVAVATKA